MSAEFIFLPLFDPGAYNIASHFFALLCGIFWELNLRMEERLLLELGTASFKSMHIQQTLIGEI